MGRGRSGLSSDGPVIAAPKQVNAVNLLIEHRQELTLTDSQFAHVVVIKRALDSTDMPLLRKIDSVQRLFKSAPLFSNPSPERRDSIAEAKAFVKQTAAALQDNLSAGRDKAFGLLSSQQFDKAEQLAADAQKAIDDAADSGDGRGGGRGGRPPTG